MTADDWLVHDDYFEDLAVLSLGPIHPGGFQGTNDLVNLVPWAGRRVLDIGCGTGFTAVLLTTLGASVVGLEPSVMMREAAISNGLDPDRVVAGSLETAPETMRTQGPFDVVLLEGISGFVKDLRLKITRLVVIEPKPSYVIVADWCPHNRGERRLPHYTLAAHGETDPIELISLFSSLGYDCTIKRSEATAKRTCFDVGEALRRASLFFPKTSEDILLLAVSRKVTLMNNTWTVDVPVERFVLAARSTSGC